MRVLDLTDEDGGLRRDTMARLAATAAYPEDEAARDELRTILAAERDRFVATGEDFAPSDVARLLESAMEKRVGQLALTGCVAIALTLLQAFGHRATLKRVATIVSDLVYSDGKGEDLWVSHRKGSAELRRGKAVGDVDSIEKAFRARWAAAPVLAASVSMGEWRDQEHQLGLDPAPTLEACLVKTAIEFEARLRLVEGSVKWNIWSVARGAPRWVWDLPSLMPSDGMLSAILGPNHCQSVVGSPWPGKLEPEFRDGMG